MSLIAMVLITANLVFTYKQKTWPALLCCDFALIIYIALYLMAVHQIGS